MIEEIGESDDQIVALVSETGSQKVSPESSGESDCSQNTDVAILENSTKCEGKARYNDTIVIQKVGELIANLHILLVKKALKRIRKGTSMNTRDVSMVGLLISRPTGIVFCKYIMPFSNVVPTLIQGRIQGLIRSGYRRVTVDGGVSSCVIKCSTSMVTSLSESAASAGVG